MSIFYYELYVIDILGLAEGWPGKSVNDGSQIV